MPKYFQYKLLLLFFLLLAFAVITGLTLSGGMYAADMAVHAFLTEWIPLDLTAFFWCIMLISGTIFVIVFMVVLFIVPHLRNTYALPALASLTMSVLLNQLLKAIFARPRPDLVRIIKVSGFSFPSGHSMNNMALYATIIMLIVHQKYPPVWKWGLCIGLGLFVLLVGISRIYLGAHYFSDVFGGFTLGLCVALLVHMMPDTR